MDGVLLFRWEGGINHVWCGVKEDEVEGKAINLSELVD